MPVTITGTGPTLLRTFAFPDINATILTSAAAVTAAQGGTGITSYTTGDFLVATGATTLTHRALVAGDIPNLSATYEPVISNLPVSKGGTGLTSYTTGDLVYASGASTLSKLGIGASNTVLVGGSTPTYSATPSLSTLTLSSNLILDPASQMKWGATASFPMIRSSGTQVQFVLADGSAYGPVQAGEFITNTAGGGTGFGVFSTAVKIGTNPAATGALRVANNQFANGRDSTNTVDYALIGINGSNQVAVGDAAVRHIINGSDIQWGKALVALGGGAAPTLGTIGGSGPATAAQNTWMRVLDSTGAAFWVPAWK